MSGSPWCQTPGLRAFCSLSLSLRSSDFAGSANDLPDRIVQRRRHKGGSGANNLIW
jgi:hypothetical protein